MSTPLNAVIAQSGGPTAVINQSLVGAIEVLREAPAVGRILGARHAVAGIVKDDYVELQNLGQPHLEQVADTPAAALGSSRDRPDAAYCARILDSFARHDVRYFFYIGGNDSSDTCRLVLEQAQASGYELEAFHIPKTIDNDLVLNDHTPGYASAANFVARAFVGDNLDNEALPGIKLNVLMGRHAGFLTAAAALGRERDEGGPHLLYLPEVAVDEDRFLTDVDRVFTRRGRCLVAISEGIAGADGTPMAVKLAQRMQLPVEQDAHGNVQLSGSGALADALARFLKRNLGRPARVRADTFGYLQRSYLGSATPTDRFEAREVGRHAARTALETDRTDGSITIERIRDDPYGVRYGCVDLEAVAGKTRHVPLEWIEEGCDVNEAFIRYARPLVGELPRVARL